MAEILDLTKFTFNGDTLKGVGELSFELMTKERNALTFVSTFGNIKVEKEIGFIGEGGLVGVKNNGCDPVPQEFAASSRVVKWTPEDWEILLHLCYKDLDGTIAEYERKNGLKKPDFTESDYEAIVETLLARALNKFLWRLIWFNDKNAANVSNGGVIKNGVDVKYFNIIDGLWKQIFAQATSNPEQRITITENTASTKAAQKVTPATARNIFETMIYSAPLELTEQSDRFILSTLNLYNEYKKSLSDSARVALESVESNFINGVKAVKIDGVEIIAVPEWDQHIHAYEDNGTTYNLPMRAIYTTRRVLGVGFDKEGDFNKLDVWYDRDSRKVKIEGMGNADAKLLHPGLFIAAY